jgi:uncharacterized protein (DUF2235 family)
MKRLVVCFDGTWNTADNGGSPTNVVRLARLINPVDHKGVVQTVLYDAGVGTGNFVDRIAGGALGNGLERRVKAGYLFLAQNYEKDDEIYIYGFSRGAFTARSLAGFISASRGLLYRQDLHKLEAAWHYYRTPPKTRNSFLIHNEIERHVRTEAKITCLGVWDTVGSLGIPSDLFNTANRARYAFHDTQLSPLIAHAFQALAIDEKRGPFEAAVWEKPAKPIPKQIVEQVWFAGVHADIGGSYESSELSDLALRWMIARTIAHTGLEFDELEMRYFLPEKFYQNKKTRGAAIKRIEEKWKGPLHESLGRYWLSRLSPRIRIMGGQVPRLGIAPFKKLFRTSAKSKKPAFCQALHWSANRRFNDALSAGLPKYDPPNLRVAIDDLKLVERNNELKKGIAWEKQRDRSSHDTVDPSQ